MVVRSAQLKGVTIGSQVIRPSALLLIAVSLWTTDCVRGLSKPVPAVTYSSDSAPGDAAPGDVTRHERGTGPLLIIFEAEDGAITSPFAVVRDDPNASGGAYLLDDWHTTGTQTTGKASYTFSLLRESFLRLWGRAIAQGSDTDSFYVAFDGQNQVAFHTVGETHSDTWQWVVLLDLDLDEVVSFKLSAGTHTLVLSSRESQSKLDKMVLTDDPTFVP